MYKHIRKVSVGGKWYLVLSTKKYCVVFKFKLVTTDAFQFLYTNFGSLEHLLYITWQHSSYSKGIWQYTTL